MLAALKECWTPAKAKIEAIIFQLVKGTFLYNKINEN